MGYLENGRWIVETGLSTQQGRYVRTPTTFRERITADGSSGYPAESGRYHLYVSLSCPWAHRVLLVRKLRGLEEAISVTVADPVVDDDGWEFTERPGCTADTECNTRFLREVYLRAKADYTGRATVPVLWDRVKNTIVNNESLEIMRMLDLEFDACAKLSVHFCTRESEAEVNEAIHAIYQSINNGVYRVGFARTQEAYDEAVTELFTALERWDKTLSQRRFLCGDAVTEADLCFFVTLIRFDCAYYGAFECNQHRIVEYPNLWRYIRELYFLSGVAETCNFDHIRQHYYLSYPNIRPRRIVPIGSNASFAELSCGAYNLHLVSRQKFRH